MADNDLFSPTDVTNTDVDPNKNYYEELVGEGRKFKDNEALAKKAIYSDAHIAKLEEEMAELREDHRKAYEELKTRKSMEELLDKMANNAKGPTEPVTNPATKDVSTNAALDVKQIEQLVFNKLNDYQIAQKRQENANSARKQLQDAYGSNYLNTLRNKATELGLTEDYLNSLAQASPDAFMKLVGPEKKVDVGVFTPPVSIKNSAFKPTGSGQRTRSYYKEMRNQDPVLYNSRAMVLQRHNDAQKLGEAFFDVDD